MNKNPEWYLIEIGQVDEKGDRLTDHGLKFETPAGDLEGAKWLAQAALADLARSKDISPAKLTSTITPCTDC